MISRVIGSKKCVTNALMTLSPSRNHRGSDPRAELTSPSRGMLGMTGREAGAREDRSGSSSVLGVVPGELKLIVAVVNVVVVAVDVEVRENPRGPREALLRVTSRNYEWQTDQSQ